MIGGCGGSGGSPEQVRPKGSEDGPSQAEYH